ncbi:hypothetical protein [Bacillus pumilus]|uniref:hypothetical protein n=1 Tax=Bacillus pumilus TaxID=1408 RepID=UPI0011A95D23|nr:hypothetical protein [Bacillus pumilus]
MRKQYRYITNGIALGQDKLSDFRLIAGKNIKASFDGDVALRVAIPNDVELIKFKSDPYSTTNEHRTLDELGYDVLIWSEKNKKWKVYNEFKGIRPCDMHSIRRASQ